MSKASDSNLNPQADNMLPNTLTEAQAKAGYYMRLSVENAACYSSTRTIPYAEIYRERTAVNIETPEERIQKASEDQARRDNESVR